MARVAGSAAQYFQNYRPLTLRRLDVIHLNVLERVTLRKHPCELAADKP